MRISAPVKIQRLKEQPVYINKPSDVLSLFGPSILSARLPHRDRKQFWTISLDAENGILHFELLSMGSRTHSILETDEVFRTPIVKRASKLILVRNCPKGEKMYPLKEEIAKVNELVRCGKILRVAMADYVIISGNAYYSLVEERSLHSYKKGI